MTEIAFHFNAPDKIGHGCRLLRKAVGAGARVLVTGDPLMLRELDHALWTFSALDFVAHCTHEAPEAVQLASPVLLAPDLARAANHQVLLNLGEAVVPGFERFERLIEVVTADEADRQLARLRWKHYADRGYAIVRHDLGATAGSA